MDLQFLSVIDEKKDFLTGLSDYIWEHPETAFEEFKSAKCLCDALRAEGFTVTENLADIPTAFSGSFGSGKPVIGFLGEYDALSNLDQRSGMTEQCGEPGKNGHGCGHNLLGVGSLGAAIATKRYLEETGCSGTVVYFGCPGEEGGSGKAFMAREGVFDNLDAALSWHPEANTGIYTSLNLANCQVLYKFDGAAAHAAAAPHLGRSALDAVELMNVGVNFLREHMPDRSRVHYAITNSGGFSPNVVQSHAEVLYLIRGATSKDAEALYQRVNDIAAGAALMTGTKTSQEFIKACSNTILNDTLQRILYEKMQQIGLPEATEEDLTFAREMAQKGLAQCPGANAEHPLNLELKPYYGQEDPSWGSTDVADVSWVCPTAQITAAAFAAGTPGHSWQLTAQVKLPFAYKAMLFTSKVLAATAAELFQNPELLEKAKAEHANRTGPDGYICPIPKGIRPRAISSL